MNLRWDLGSQWSKLGEGKTSSAHCFMLIHAVWGQKTNQSNMPHQGPSIRPLHLIMEYEMSSSKGMGEVEARVWGKTFCNVELKPHYGWHLSSSHGDSGEKHRDLSEGK